MEKATGSRIERRDYTPMYLNLHAATFDALERIQPTSPDVIERAIQSKLSPMERRALRRLTGAIADEIFHLYDVRKRYEQLSTKELVAATFVDQPPVTGHHWEGPLLVLETSSETDLKKYLDSYCGVYAVYLGWSAKHIRDDAELTGQVMMLAMNTKDPSFVRDMEKIHGFKNHEFRHFIHARISNIIESISAYKSQRIENVVRDTTLTPEALMPELIRRTTFGARMYTEILAQWHGGETIDAIQANMSSVYAQAYATDILFALDAVHSPLCKPDVREQIWRDLLRLVEREIKQTVGYLARARDAGFTERRVVTRAEVTPIYKWHQLTEALLKSDSEEMFIRPNNKQAA